MWKLFAGVVLVGVCIVVGAFLTGPGPRQYVLTSTVDRYGHLVPPPVTFHPAVEPLVTTKPVASSPFEDDPPPSKADDRILREWAAHRELSGAIVRLAPLPAHELVKVYDEGVFCLYESPTGLWGATKAQLGLQATDRCPGQ